MPRDTIRRAAPLEVPLLVLLSMLGLAAAQEVVTGGDAPAINVQWFRPSIDSVRFFRLTDSALPSDGVLWRATGSYHQDLMQWTPVTGETQVIVGGVAQIDAAIGYTSGRVRVGVNAPILLRSFGGTSGDATGLGQLSVDGKAQLLDRDEDALGLAASGRFLLPTSTMPDPLSGGVGLELEVDADKAFGDLVLAANVGTMLMDEEELENVSWGTQLRAGLGGSYAVTDATSVMAELLSAGTVASFGKPQSMPAELLVGANVRTASKLAVRPAAVVGISDAVGTPKFRFALAISRIPMGPEDSDGDGLVDGEDTCPDVAEDVDTEVDTDGCPEPTKVTVRVVDSDGQPVPDATWTSADLSGKAGDAVAVDAGPRTFAVGEAELDVEIPTGTGTEVTIVVPAPRATLDVKIVDAKGQPIPGATWFASGPTKVEPREPGTVAVRPGSYKLQGEAEGWRQAVLSTTLEKDGTATLVLTMEPAKAAFSGDRIEIKDSVYFETGKDLLKQVSLPLLEEVAEVLVKHAELTKIRVEGHTDSRGTASANKALSQARAEEVRDFLISKGVAPERLEAVGYGEEKPLVKGENEAAWSKNRRVDFFVVARSDGQP